MYFPGLDPVPPQFSESANVRVGLEARAGGAVSSREPTGAEVTIAMDLNIENLHVYLSRMDHNEYELEISTNSLPVLQLSLALALGGWFLVGFSTHIVRLTLLDLILLLLLNLLTDPV